MGASLDPLWEALYFGRETNPQCPFSWALDPKKFRRAFSAGWKPFFLGYYGRKDGGI